jgi:hypothetical protein
VRTAIVLVAMTLGIAGCARDGDQATVRSVADTFFGALGSGDGARACDQLTPNTRAELESQEQSACREAITTIEIDRGTVVRANVYVLSAMAELSNGQAAFLEQGEQGWRIAAVGCRRPDKPADRPFDCELED